MNPGPLERDLESIILSIRDGDSLRDVQTLRDPDPSDVLVWYRPAVMRDTVSILTPCPGPEPPRAGCREGGTDSQRS